ncbi:MAG: two-component regulator propeller domain-containing protein, partial [Ignavibacteriaceae bacterium]
MDFEKEPFRLYPISNDNVNSNKTLNIFSIYQNPNDNNFVWLGSDDGLNKYDLKGKTSKKFQHIEKNLNSIPGNLIRGIQSSSNHELWLGTDKGLSLMKDVNNSFTNYDLKNETNHYVVDYNNIYNLSMDDYGNLWIASNLAGIVKFDTKNKTKQ